MAQYIKATPNMTAINLKGFSVTSTSVGANSPYLAFDGDSNTYYRSSISPSLPEYLSITFPEEKFIFRYTLSIGKSSFANMNTWDLEGWIDGKWTTLHSGEKTTVATSVSTYDFTPIKVKGIRIKCKSRFGSNSWGVDELEVYEVIYDNRILISSNGSYSVVRKGTTLNDCAIPVMTSNILPSGVVSASSEHPNGNWSAFQAFNHFTNGWATNSLTSGWLQYEFDKRVAIAKYKLGSTTTPTGMPKDWTFEGSNDGLVWDIIDKQAGITNWVTDGFKEFNLTNTKRYRAYRVNISSNNGYSSIMIKELEMFEYTGDMKLSIPTSSEQNFLNHGMDTPFELDTTTEISTRAFFEQASTVLGSGKVFKKTIDTSQLPIKGVTIE